VLAGYLAEKLDQSQNDRIHGRPKGRPFCCLKLKKQALIILHVLYRMMVTFTFLSPNCSNRAWQNVRFLTKRPS
jgi:hypothetical protein